MIKNFENIMNRILKIGIIALVAMSLIFLFIQSTIPLKEVQKENLYNSRRIVTENFSNVANIKGTEVKVLDDKTVVTFYEKDCKLVVNYNHNKEFISEDLIDTRVSSDIGVSIGFIGIIILVAFFLWVVAYFIGLAILSFKKSEENEDELQ